MKRVRLQNTQAKFFSHLKLAKKILEKKNPMTKQTTKKWENLNFLPNGQNPLLSYFSFFPLYGGIICQLILFSNFLSNFLNRKQNLVWLFCGQTLFQAL